MPELPEVEITARLIGEAIAGAEIESIQAPGINALKTFDPPLSALVGQKLTGVTRRSKMFIVAVGEELVLLIHLMSAGRLQLFEKHAGPRDRTSRLLVRLVDGRELRLREFGTKQAAWVKLLRVGELDADEALAKLGPEAWPEPPPDLRPLLNEPRPLHTQLRDQRVIAGIGRSWVDEILWHAKLSPYKRGKELDEAEAVALREAIVSTLGGALAHYEDKLKLPLPDKLPLPLLVHRRGGEPCPRCATTLETVHFEDYVISYCPTCQTAGRTLKDRRMSRLLK